MSSQKIFGSLSSLCKDLLDPSEYLNPSNIFTHSIVLYDWSLSNLFLPSHNLHHLFCLLISFLDLYPSLSLYLSLPSWLCLFLPLTADVFAWSSQHHSHTVLPAERERERNRLSKILLISKQTVSWLVGL